MQTNIPKKTEAIYSVLKSSFTFGTKLMPSYINIVTLICESLSLSPDKQPSIISSSMPDRELAPIQRSNSFFIPDLIQTDTPVNPVNSGRP
jgi:hypothetical protein